MVSKNREGPYQMEAYWACSREARDSWNNHTNYKKPEIMDWSYNLYVRQTREWGRLDIIVMEGREGGFKRSSD